MKIKDWLLDLDYQCLQGSLEAIVEDVVYDSRKAKTGTVFVCIKGTKVDSHTFLPAVLEAGCKVIVVETPVLVPQEITVICVKEGREALAKLSAARFGYPAKNMKMIGVTGTKGKTTTTHMLKTILETAGKKTGMIGTNGVFIGDTRYPTLNTTPESYDLHRYFAQMVEAGCTFCVMEVSSQAMKMHRVAGIWFDYGLFTNISPDHIGPDEHEDFQEYLAWKVRLFHQCSHGLINQDDEHFSEIISDIPCKWNGYSLEGDSDYCAKKVRYVAEADFVGVEFQIQGLCQLPVRVNIPGKFNVYNALSAAVICLLAGVSQVQVCHGLEHVVIDGRMEIVYTSEKFCVIVDYAHNAVSMESLLTTLREYHPKRLVCVFGCGGNRSKDRRYSMGKIAGEMADLSIITADNSRFETVEAIIGDIRGCIEQVGGNYIEIPDRREAITYSMTHAEPGDMIAVIGKGHEDYQEIKGVRYPFLDRAVVEEAASKL